MMEEKQLHTAQRPMTAGDVLLTNIPTAAERDTVTATLRMLRTGIPGIKWDSVQYVYVLKRDGFLLGVVSIKNLLLADGTKKIGAIMKRDPVTAWANSSLSSVAITAIKHNIKTIPITDRKGAFKGVVGNDDILKTLQRFNVSTLLRRTGIADGELVDVMKTSMRRLVNIRTPWLVIGLIGMLFGASIVGSFEETLDQIIALAFFMPLVVFMGSAIGTQSEILYIRTIAFHKVDIHKYAAKELVLDLVIGLIVSLVALVFTYVWLHSGITSLIVASAILVNMLIAGQLSLLVSWLLTRGGKDPAVGAGPSLAVVQDVTSLVIYFLIATIYLSLV